MIPYDAELIVEQYGMESIIGAAANTIPEFVRDMDGGDPEEKKCKVFGRKEAGESNRQLCEEREKDPKSQNCGALYCGDQAKGFLNISLTDV